MYRMLDHASLLTRKKYLNLRPSAGFLSRVALCRSSVTNATYQPQCFIHRNLHSEEELVVTHVKDDLVF